ASSLIDAPAATRAVRARADGQCAVDAGGTTWVAQAVPLDNGWSLVAARPKPNLAGLRWTTAATVGCVLAAGIALAWKLARHLGRPLARLAEVAPLIVEGRRGRSAYIGHDGEVGEVAVCIDRLAADLDQARQNAERAVEERTRDLREANALLDRAHAQASSANAAKDQFLANMSHEIRTPLTAIIGYAELLIDLDMEEQERVKALHAIQNNGEHLLSIINDVLDLSKMEADMMHLEAIECQPVALILDVLSLMGTRAREKRLELEVAYVTPIPERIHTDPTRLRQILINLVGNAIKFTHEGSVRLNVGMAEDAGPDQIPLLRFDVTDTGVGIAPEQMGQLFQPFKQADPSMTRKFGGTGLGLVISKRLAKLLGGDIAVRSALGEGTTFTATVRAGPVRGIRMLHPGELNTAVVAEVPMAAEEQAALSLHGYKVLVADDTPENGRIIAKMLDSAGALVTVADGGRVALHAAMEALNAMAPFDVILMDMQMADVNGYDTTKRLRTLGYPSPIVALTANAMSSDREKCLAVGCSDYAVKPIDRRKLVALVRKWCVAGTRPGNVA
ncbi:MAG TPA: ATP-binding protein, partial [Tepidisphaeraceae bacterium]|nr:ATP-binding protein [Tepidisphaeraceae bacterium]